MGALDISDAYSQVDQPTPKKIVSLIVQMPITLFIGAYMDSVMALVVGMIIFQVLCKQSWVVNLCPIFFHYSNCPDDKGFLLAHVDDVLFAINE